MIRVLMSSAAAGLLRAILSRAGIARERVLLTEIRSVDWQSLTIVGERHEIACAFPVRSQMRSRRRCATDCPRRSSPSRG